MGPGQWAPVLLQCPERKMRRNNDAKRVDQLRKPSLAWAARAAVSSLYSAEASVSCCNHRFPYNDLTLSDATGSKGTSIAAGVSAVGVTAATVAFACDGMMQQELIN